MAADHLEDAPCYLNGDYMALREARVPVLDRGFIFGDGVYEVVPVYQRRPFRLPQHLTRLERSLSEVRIVNPRSREEWRAIIDRLTVSAAAEDLVIYLQVTR